MSVPRPKTIAEAGDFRLVRETRPSRIQEYWAIQYTVVVVEFGAHYVRLWPIKHHDKSIYMLAYHGDRLAGGFRFLHDMGDSFYTYSQFDRVDTLPDPASLKSLGNVGEASSLILLPEFRGQFDISVFGRAALNAARDDGLTHLLLNAVIPRRVPLLYGAFGFQPYADPQFEPRLRRYDGDTTPNVIPMIAAVEPGAPMPPDRWSYSIDDLTRMADRYNG